MLTKEEYITKGMLLGMNYWERYNAFCIEERPYTSNARWFDADTLEPISFGDLIPRVQKWRQQQWGKLNAGKAKDH
jgi:hypothetical protein